MNRPNKFDTEVRKKMMLLEDEPSAAVWAGIRGETGLVLQPERGLWAYRTMAAASVIFLITLAIFLGGNPNENSGEIAVRTDTTATPRITPERYQDQYATETKREIPAPEKNMPWYGSPDIAVENNFAVQEAPREEDELKIEQAPMPQPIFVEETPQPKIQEDGPKKELSPLNQDKVEVYASNSNPESNVRQGNKRTFRLPRPEDLTKENLEKRTRGILGTIASSAKDYLGINTKYKENEEENLRTTAFSANLGFLKVKKTRTIKTDKK